jgi:hypothetical protein
MQRLFVALILVIAVSWHLSSLFDFSTSTTLAQASSEEAWRKEFDDICVKTEDPMGLSAEELRGLVGRCRTLEKVIEGLDESTRKVYLKRLSMCRDLFIYMLTVKESEKKE